MNGFNVVFLDIISLSSIAACIMIIIAKNPIISVLYLIFLFTNISCYLILLGIKFIGISYLLVYVGAVSILFLFILMLINIRVSELISNTNNGIPLAVLTILAFFVPYSKLLPNAKTNTNETALQINSFIESVIEKNKISYVSSNNWDSSLVDISDIMSIGNIMYTSYALWLIITSIILLLAMVGSIVITIKQKY